MGKGIDQVLNLGRDTSALFTGGMSGTDVAKGQTPTSQHIGEDIAGLGAGAGLAEAGIGSAAGGEAAASASPQGLNPALAGSSGGAGLNPAVGGGVGLNPVTGGAAFNAGLSPELQALMSGGSGAVEALNAGTPAFVGTSGGPTGPFSGGATPAAPSAPSVGAGSASPAAGAGTAPTAVTGTAGQSEVDKILGTMRANAGLAQLGLAGAGLAMASKKPQIPNADQLNQLAATGSQAAKDLIGSYRSGQLSAAQQASLDQLTQGTKNQINQYFASIGQSDSTAHMQALAQVDQQALGMKQQMLDNMLQQGLQAIGVAGGPLSTIANYEMQQDKNLTEAFGNFANAVGQAFGKQAGTAENPNKRIAGSTPSSGANVVTSDSLGSVPSSGALR